MTPEDLAKLAVHLGFKAECRYGCQPAVQLRRGRRYFLAGFGGRIPDNNLYSVVILEALIASARTIRNIGVAGEGGLIQNKFHRWNSLLHRSK